MRHARRIFLQAAFALVVLGSLPGCGSPVAVKSAYDRSVDFQRFRTFAMLLPNKPVSENSGMDPFVMQRLRQLTYEELQARGMQHASKDSADVIVAVLAGSKEKVEVYSRSYYGYPYGAPAWGYDVRTYEEGTLVIDLIERERNAVIWRGTGSRTISGGLSDEQMREVVARVLSQYPPAPPAAN